MKQVFLAVCFCIPLLSSVSFADILLSEDFEDTTLTYTVNEADGLGDIENNNFYGLVSDADLATSGRYGNLQGSGFYAVQDSDNATGGGGATSSVVLSWSLNAAQFGGDVFTDLELSWMVAEAKPDENDWDDGLFQILVGIDGGALTPIFAIAGEDEVEGATEKARVVLDPVNSTTGNGGAEVSSDFTLYSESLLDAQSVDIEVRFTGFLAEDEDLAFDNLVLEGIVAIPEPCTGLFAFSAVAGLFVRRRRA